MKRFLILLFFSWMPLQSCFAQNLIQQGYGLLKEKKYREAYDKFNEAIKETPDSSRAFRGRGEIDFILLKDTVGALADYNKAIELNPNYGIAYCNRGVVESWMKNYEEALIDYNKAIELMPTFEKTYSDRGHCKLFLKDYPGAIVDFNKAIELKPDYAMAYMGRGNAEKRMKLYDLALEDFDKALKCDSSLQRLYNTNVYSSAELKKLKGFCFIKMENRNGVYYIMVEIDGVLTEVIFDTGAATLSMSAVEAAYLRGKGMLTDEDNRGYQNMFDATGKVTTVQIVNIKSVKIGCKELDNVTATIVPSLNAPILMGQTALSKFGKISIDYQKLTITFQP